MYDQVIELLKRLSTFAHQRCCTHGNCQLREGHELRDRREEHGGKEVLAADSFHCLLLAVSGASRSHSPYFPSWRNTFSIGSLEIRRIPSNG
jgi:hypothetical protein